MPNWLNIILHVLVIAGGVSASILSGTPIPGVIAGAINALLPSPVVLNRKQ